MNKKQMYKHRKNFVNEIPVLLENLSILNIFDNNKIFYNIDNFIRYFKANIFEKKNICLQYILFCSSRNVSLTKKFIEKSFDNIISCMEIYFSKLHILCKIFLISKMYTESFQ